MSETDDKCPTVSDCPDDAAAENSPTSCESEDSSGCLAFFLLLAVIDAIGAFAPRAGPYTPVVLVLGLVGFFFGTIVGSYAFARASKRPWWSSYRWIIYGLLGTCLFTFASIFASIKILKMP
jgi:hypothetical protein